MALKSFIFISLFSICSCLLGQEIRGRVQISTPGMSEHERQIMRTLQGELNELFNQTSWTNYEFHQNERIEASIRITIDEKEGADVYKGTIQVQSRRPIYNSSYSSPILNINDRDLQFRYSENENLEYSDNTFQHNITSIIAFYAYIIIGFDFDTFKPLGGTEFFQKAENVVNLAQNASEPGWQSFQSQRNRYWLVENLFNTQYQPVREAMYKYHRKGFDKLVDNTDIGRENVTEALELLRRAHRQRPGSYLMQIIMTTKNDELVNLYSEASSNEQSRAIEILSEIDPSNSSKYRRIAD